MIASPIGGAVVGGIAAASGLGWPFGAFVGFFTGIIFMPFVLAAIWKKDHIVGLLVVFGPASLVAWIIGNGWQVAPVWLGSISTLLVSCVVAALALPDQLLDPDPKKCSSCDYDLSGLPTHITKCPECGKPIEPQSTASES